jgi:hypothetical protein
MALGPRENENATSAWPAKDPLALPSLTKLGTNLAEAVPRRPVHETLTVAVAPVVSSSPPGQLTGLLEKDPSTFPFVMWTEGSLALHPDNEARIFVGALPPPEDVSGGESESLAENEQLIEPSAGPEKWRCLVAAEAGVTATNTPATASSTVAAGTQARRVQNTFVGAAARSLTKGPLPIPEQKAWPKLVVTPSAADAIRGSIDSPANRDCGGSPLVIGLARAQR